MVKKEKGGPGAETRTMRKRRRMGMIGMELAYNTAHIIYYHSYNMIYHHIPDIAGRRAALGYGEHW